MLLDETYWCVFNDGIPSNQRRWQSEPQGIEIRQTIFASSTAGALSNTVFVRYRIKNTGTVTDTLNNVYFSMWADADLGDHSDDFYGCDTLRQAVYFYNDSTDLAYGDSVPSYMMDLLTGPHSYIPGVTFIDVNGNNIYENGIDTPLDTAVNYLGPIGVTIFPGAKNQEINSCITYVNSDPVFREPHNINEVRNYNYGLELSGNVVDPCNWNYGEVRGGVPCNQVNPYFWFSGDPVMDVGWIFTYNRDVRGVGSTGSFILVKDQEVEVLIGYEIDRSTTPVGGITAVRNISDEVQIFYENNFGYPIVSVEDEPQVVSGFKLEQNYPNPFNPTTKISWQSPVSSWQTLKVFDLLGNEVATLVNNELPASEYEVEFDAIDLSTGIYFYTLKAGSFVQTKKMVLIK